jgi:hypothetical protein
VHRSPPPSTKRCLCEGHLAFPARSASCNVTWAVAAGASASLFDLEQLQTSHAHCVPDQHAVSRSKPPCPGPPSASPLSVLAPQCRARSVSIPCDTHGALAAQALAPFTRSSCEPGLNRASHYPGDTHGALAELALAYLAQGSCEPSPTRMLRCLCGRRFVALNGFSRLRS